MMIELQSEDDIWRLFGGENHHQPGKWQQSFLSVERHLLDTDGFHKHRPDVPAQSEVATAKKKIKQRFPLKDTERLYLLTARGREACVDQSRLLRVGKAMSRSGQSVTVQYLGADLETAQLGSDPEENSRAQRTTARTRRGKPMSSVKNDSIDKIVTSYFATLTTESFKWRGKTYEPRDVWVSPGIVRGFTCPAGCGGCCPRFSLDYIVPDYVPKGHPLTKRIVDFDGREVEVWSDMQDDHKGEKCRNLNFEDGRCRIHGSQPFSCDFELLRSITHKKKAPRADFTQKLYGRGWAMMRVDGQRGALCEMIPVTDESVADVDRRLARLETWMKHFGLNPSRVGMIRAALPKIAASGNGFWIAEREQQTQAEGGE